MLPTKIVVIGAGSASLANTLKCSCAPKSWPEVN
jgi:hypothetical protein